jgi:glycosyltransferase involved in cell wall biosynthesis
MSRVAISHEWLTIPGGSENVVLEILKLYPGAELFTTVYEPSAWPEAITSRPVHPSILDRLPGARRHYPKLLPLMDAAFRRFDLRGFDLVVSSNHACAKNVRAPDGALHVCYCHTPMRYAWDPSFLEGEELGLAGRIAFRASLRHLRRTDLRGARGVHRFAANSTFVRERIRRWWGRDADVVHPPVAVERYLEAPRTAGDDAPYLVFGRMVPYKRADLAVAACERLGRPVLVAGTGRDEPRVRAAAGPHTTFLGHVAHEDLPALFGRCRALIFPGLEDFGIVPVEAQAAGLPVIAFGEGGSRDTVLDGETGVLFEPQTVEGLCAAIERFEGLALDDRRLREHAAPFGAERFRREFAACVERAAAERA